MHKPVRIYKTIASCLLWWVVLAGCRTGKIAVSGAGKVAPVKMDTLTWFDDTRQRPVPVALFFPATKQLQKLPVVIFSHGYGQNRGGDYLAYSYLTGFLAAHGFFVASIQHELPTDSLMPAAGIPQVVRKPFWERGTDNILFVLSRLKMEYPQLQFKHLALIGHSNGADMTALFGQTYPALADKIITLDNRRMALPLTRHPRVFTLRSSDQPADQGVLPGPAAQKRFGIKIIQLPATKHNDMDDHANEAQRKEITTLVFQFLQQ